MSVGREVTERAEVRIKTTHDIFPMVRGLDHFENCRNEKKRASQVHLKWRNLKISTVIFRGTIETKNLLERGRNVKDSSMTSLPPKS